MGTVRYASLKVIKGDEDLTRGHWALGILGYEMQNFCHLFYLEGLKFDNSLQEMFVLYKEISSFYSLNQEERQSFFARKQGSGIIETQLSNFIQALVWTEESKRVELSEKEYQKLVK